MNSIPKNEEVEERPRPSKKSKRKRKARNSSADTLNDEDIPESISNIAEELNEAQEGITRMDVDDTHVVEEKKVKKRKSKKKARMDYDEL